MKIIIQVEVEHKDKTIIRHKQELKAGDTITVPFDGMKGFPIRDDETGEKVSHFLFTTMDWHKKDKKKKK